MNRINNILADGQVYYQNNRKKIWILGAAILLLTIIFSVGFVTKTVTAQREADRVKLVKSIEIQKGDTLWSIASENMSDEYDDLNDYIDEIMDSNGMASDEIHVGNYIIVPYYADASN
jgi:cell division protein YceG involved in septum cleavage